MRSLLSSPYSSQPSPSVGAGIGGARLDGDMYGISKITGRLFGPFSPAGRGKRAGSPEEVAPSGRHGLDLRKGCLKGEALLKLFWKGQRPSEALLEGFKS